MGPFPWLVSSSQRSHRRRREELESELGAAAPRPPRAEPDCPRPAPPSSTWARPRCPPGTQQSWADCGVGSPGREHQVQARRRTWECAPLTPWAKVSKGNARSPGGIPGCSEQTSSGSDGGARAAVPGSSVLREPPPAPSTPGRDGAWHRPRCAVAPADWASPVAPGHSLAWAPRGPLWGSPCSPAPVSPSAPPSPSPGLSPHGAHLPWCLGYP